MKQLYRISVKEERAVAPDEVNALEAAGIPSRWVAETDDLDETLSFLRVEELTEPEATLHFTQEELSFLIERAASYPLRDLGATPSRAKAKLDVAVWQLSAQRTMLERSAPDA